MFPKNSWEVYNAKQFDQLETRKQLAVAEEKEVYSVWSRKAEEAKDKVATHIGTEEKKYGVDG